VIGYPDGSSAGAGGRVANLRVQSVGGAVLGVTYGMGGRSVGAEEGEAAAAAAPAGAVAPPGLFSKRVPTVADVRLLPAGELPRAAAAEALAARSAAAFTRGGEVAALLEFGGRRTLREFDFCDVLPPLRRGDRSPRAGGGGGFAGGGAAATALEARLRALAEALPGAALVTPLPLDAPSGLPSAAALAFRRPRAAVFRAGGDAAGSGAAAPAGGGFALGAHAVAAPWRAARVRTLTGAEAAALFAELTRATRRRASFAGRSATFGDAEAWDAAMDGGGGGGEGGAGAAGARSPAAGDAPQPYAFWFEPAARAGGGVSTLLRVAPLAALRAVAPPGAHTWPWAPGQPVEARRLGGAWGAATVEAADRLLLRLRLAAPLPPPAAAGAARLPGGGCAVRVDAGWGRGARSGGGGGGSGARWRWWGGGAAAPAPAPAAGEGGGEAPAPPPPPAVATLLAVVGAAEEAPGAAAAGGDEPPLPVPLGGGAGGGVEPGCEVVPAQLWGIAVRRAGSGGARDAAKGAAAALLLSAAKRAAGADVRHLIGPHVKLDG
jgi:hypothetical protein